MQSRLPEVLREFTRVHRAVDLELTVGMSGALFQALDAAELDLVLAKRRPGEDRGRLVRRERLVWIAGDSALADPDRPLPLILYPPPSISRAMALEALERAGQQLAHRLHQQQPERPQCRSIGRAWGMRPGRGLCAGRARGVAAIGGDCRSSATSNSSSLAAGEPCAVRRKRLATAILDNADRL